METTNGLLLSVLIPKRYPWQALKQQSRYAWFVFCFLEEKRRRKKERKKERKNERKKEQIVFCVD